MNGVSINVPDVLNKIQELVDKDEVFSLSDLYPRVVWNRISKRERLNLGRYFYDYVSKLNPNNIVEIMEKDSSNRQLYKKL